MSRDLVALPKPHLHLHFEATVRPDTLADLADAAGRPVPATRRWRGFTEFAAAYGELIDLIRQPADLTRLMHELAEDQAAQGVTYVELSVAPEVYAGFFGSPEAALAALLADAEAASVRHGVVIRFMVAIDRTAGPEAALASARLAAAFADEGVVALGLHAEERGFPAADFAEPYRIARDAGLLATPHAGELVGPESVWQALDVLHADRILHGVRSVEDPALVAELVRRGSCLDVCPSSNLLLEVVPSIEAHPLPLLLEAGVACSINADDPILFGPDVLAEYDLASSVLGLTAEQLARCARAGFTASGAPAAVKAAGIAGVEAWLVD